MKFIVGPNESKEEFEKRVASCSKQPVISVFGLKPDWIPVHYSNRSLAPWEGGCAWIQEGRVALQLRKSLEKRESYLGLVSKKELLEHEAVHALRVAFDEPRFEELLAYQTSVSSFRRFFGPFFRSAKESLIFSCLLLLFPLTLPFPFLQLPFAGLLTVVTALGSLRLLRSQKIFRKTKSNLSALTDNPLAFMICLTDKEIDLFSRMNPEEIEAFAKQQSSFRWRYICSHNLVHYPVLR